jgi:hypothetical protein
MGSTREWQSAAAFGTEAAVSPARLVNERTALSTDTAVRQGLRKARLVQGKACARQGFCKARLLQGKASAKQIVIC